MANTPTNAINVTTTGAVSFNATTGLFTGSTLSVANGGSGTATLTGVLTGNGTSAFTASPVTQNGVVTAGASNTLTTVAPGTSGNVLTSNGTTWASSPLLPENLPWTIVTGTTQAMTTNNGYIANNASLVTFTLPTTSAVGDIVSVAGYGLGGWQINQNALQNIIISPTITITGTAGSIASTNRYDGVRLTCVVANKTWQAVTAPQSQGLTLATFNPLTSISGCLCWLDATQLALGAVASWTDLSGNGNTPTQGTGANQPTNTASTYNGLNAVVFNGTTTNLVFSSSTFWSLPMTAFIVGYLNPSTSAQIMPKASGSTNGNTVMVTGSNGNPRLQIRDAVQNNSVDFSPALIAGNQFIFGASCAATDGSALNIFVNTNTPVTSGTTLSGYVNNSVAMRLGSNSSGSASYLDGYIGEVLIYNSVLSADQRAQVNGYLSAKWGVAVT